MSYRPPRGVLAELMEEARAQSQKRRGLRAPLPSRRTVPPQRGRFLSALQDASRTDFPLICEVKRASPSAGGIATGADVVEVARAYQASGARCVSVLTEGSRFDGSLDDLRAVRAAVTLPLLRKDFIADVNMVEEAAEAGADAVLLIAAALPPALLTELSSAAAELGLDVLLELIFERDLEALGLGDFPLVGINARDLETLEVDPARFSRLAPFARAEGRLLVAESGVKSPADISRLKILGAGAALVGESLMRAPDRAQLLRALAEAA